MHALKRRRKSHSFQYKLEEFIWGEGLLTRCIFLFTGRLGSITSSCSGDGGNRAYRYYAEV